jgi:predicted amidohydrolase
LKTGITYWEGVHFKPGKRISYFDTPFGRIGIVVCLDIFHPEIAHAQAIAGCWLILQPSATPLVLNPNAPMPPPLNLGRGFENSACFAYINIVGDQLGISYNGGTSVIQGVAGCQILASHGKEAKEEVIEYEIDPADIYAARARFPMLRDVRPDLMKQLWEISNRARYGE